MSSPLQTHTPRPKPLLYDALGPKYGCATTSKGVAKFGLKAIANVCLAKHSKTSSIFAGSQAISRTLGPSTQGVAVEPYIQDWIAWVASAGVRYMKGQAVTRPSDSLGAVSPLFPTAKLTQHLTFAFDGHGRPAMAVTSSATGSTLRYYSDATTIETVAVNGISPILLYTGNLLHLPEDDRELVCLFLRPAAPKKIMVLFQRDGFTQAYVVMPDLRAPLSALLSADIYRSLYQDYPDDPRRQFVIYARSASGDDVTLYTADYHPEITPDPLACSVALASVGSIYSATAAIATGQSDNSQVSASLYGGNYVDVTADAPTIPNETARITLTLQDGSYDVP